MRIELGILYLYSVHQRSEEYRYPKAICCIVFRPLNE